MYSIKSDIDPNLIDEVLSKLNIEDIKQYQFVIDSRQAIPDSIFCAYPGAITDGRRYIGDVANTVKAILYEPGIKFKYDVAHFAISNLAKYVGLFVNKKYENPSSKMLTVGITGTNGKTSISYWLAQIYDLLNIKSAIIGTTGCGIYPNITNANLTTPDPITLGQLINQFKNNQVKLLAMEVSSIGLDQGRVNGISFQTAIFTNLTQDHLDYHKTMHAYYEAKRELFFWHSLKSAVINTDDSYGVKLISELSSNADLSDLKVISYGINTPADVMAKNINITLGGMEFDLSYRDLVAQIKIDIIGKFNIYNILAVVATMLSHNYKFEEISPLLAKLTPVRGRMDIIRKTSFPLVIIDFAHTPDALRNTLLTLKEVEHSGKLYCVFGCGGDRDRTKRPLMGAIATELADFVCITSDNPRGEDPESIISEIKVGVAANNYKIIVDRQDAIIQTIKNATSDDIIVIAGKGHETYQEIKGTKYPFSDFAIANLAMES